MESSADALAKINATQASKTVMYSNKPFVISMLWIESSLMMRAKQEMSEKLFYLT